MERTKHETTDTFRDSRWFFTEFRIGWNTCLAPNLRSGRWFPCTCAAHATRGKTLLQLSLIGQRDPDDIEILALALHSEDSSLVERQ
jgi:hypothetical protein